MTLVKQVMTFLFFTGRRVSSSLFRSTIRLGLILGSTSFIWGDASEPLRLISRIVEPQAEHVHSSSLTWTSGNQLLACWYQGSGERTADDTRILGSVSDPKSGVWGAPFELADTPDFPDCNPVVFTDKSGLLHLFWVTIRGHRWERSLLMHKTSREWDTQTNQPVWNWQEVILLKPGSGFVDAVRKGFQELDRDESMWAEFAAPYSKLILQAAANPVNRQEGWMPRNHPIELDSGAMILPLYSDGFNLSLMAISDIKDQGMRWKASQPVVGWGPIQPAVVERDDHSLVAWFRDSGDGKGRIQISESKDSGMTWSPAIDTDLPNPGSSMAVIRLSKKNAPEGNSVFAMIYNHSEDKRNQMRLALSMDQGKTWPMEFSRGLGALRELSYPSLMEGKEGRLHVSYSEKTNRGESIGYESFDLSWVYSGFE